MHTEDTSSSKVSIVTTRCLQHHQGKTILLSLRTGGVGKAATAFVVERLAKDMEKSQRENIVHYYLHQFLGTTCTS